MAEIPLDALVPRAAGPVASIYLVPGARTTVLKVYPQPLDRRTYNAVEVEQAKLVGLRSAASIVRVEALDELPDGRTGLRMEFCPQSLPDLVANGPLPIGDVVILGQILSSVLAEAHEAGLVHGGVTPANVLERPSGQPALADFGLALRLRFPRDLMADAAYTAPEVLRDGELSENADVYGLGAVLYLALTGQPPFPARTGEPADGVVLRVLREPPPEVSGRDVPPALSGLLLRMMAKEPDARPDAATVVREFEELLTAPPAEDELDFDDFSDELAAGRTVPMATITATPVIQKKRKKTATPRKSRKGLLIGAAAAVSLVAVVPVMIQPGRDDEAATPAPTPTASTPTSPAATAPTKSPIVLKPPQDKGTSVVLAWSFPKKLDRYAVFVAEQGAKEPRVAYSGAATSTTVQVNPGLKYCVQIQGTDGEETYLSAARSLRGATCIS
ncbi:MULTISPECIES: protein kinase domain-containing protein [unclassified Kribbella]|uniref:protein kinase domain-containing protein n=1 Tax=unclassified Kribbella TaxID=2644121 RepID=UPI0030189771